MEQGSTTLRQRVIVIGALVALAGTSAGAQTATGQAHAVQAVVAGALGSTVTTLADTGTLTSGDDARDASAADGSVPNLLTGNTLHAATVGSLATVSSEASVGDVLISVAGTSIGAGFVMARALADSAMGTAGTISISDLAINGVAVPVSGEKNQTIFIPAGRLVINEQQSDGAGTTVNALHVVVDGVADVVVASATARVQ